MAAFKEISRNSGVDSLPGKTAHIVVPLGKVNYLRVENAAGISLKATEAPAKIQITKLDRSKHKEALGATAATGIAKGDDVYAIKGLQGGSGRIGMSGGNANAEMTFSVHPRTILMLNFFFLADEGPNGRAIKRSVFKDTDVDKWVKFANDVFIPQANIWCEKANVAVVPVKPLDTAISVENEGQFINQKLAQAAAVPKAKKGGEKHWALRIFLAGDNVTSPDKGEPYGFHSRQSHAIVLKDQPAPAADAKFRNSLPKTMCHEIAHYLNAVRGNIGGDHGVYAKQGFDSDILDTMDESNIKIPKQRVYDWNPW
jgi:hypothetical protein